MFVFMGAHESPFDTLKIFFNVCTQSSLSLGDAGERRRLNAIIIITPKSLCP